MDERLIIRGGQIINDDQVFTGSIVIEGDTITHIFNDASPDTTVSGCQVIDATGRIVMPGVIDEHVHFREPGLTEKADIDSESQAAAAGGVTSYFDMPNTVPQTTTLEALQEKQALAAQKSHVNYAFFFGATNDNTPLFEQLDPHTIPGIKLFMGSSTGNMLVDSDAALDTVFSTCSRLRLPIMAHCEDTAEISRNMEDARQRYGDDPPLWLHPLIRSEEACFNSTMKAYQLAVTHQTQLHIAHVSTAEEIELLPYVHPSTFNVQRNVQRITAEATVGHLCFSLVDYQELGTRIKVNPAIKSCRDMIALRQALNDGRIATIATDHAPHLLSQKQGGCVRAASGMPMIQFALPLMLGLVDEGVLTLNRLVQLMCHNPAQLFSMRQRGFLRPGYKADVTIVRRTDSPWTVTPDIILSRCGWSPLEGRQLQWRVEHTICNGHIVYTNGQVDTNYIAQPIDFR